MVWLGNDCKELALTASVSGASRSQEKFHLTDQIPFIRIVARWYAAYSLCRHAYKKLAIIRHKIDSTHFKHLKEVTALLRELMHLKKLLADFSPVQNKSIKKVLTQADALKKWLISTAHYHEQMQVSTKRRARTGEQENSHHQVLSLLDQRPAEKFQLSVLGPNILYWRYSSVDVLASPAPAIAFFPHARHYRYDHPPHTHQEADLALPLVPSNK